MAPDFPVQLTHPPSLTQLNVLDLYLLEEQRTAEEGRGRGEGGGEREGKGPEVRQNITEAE